MRTKQGGFGLGIQALLSPSLEEDSVINARRVQDHSETYHECRRMPPSDAHRPRIASKVRTLFVTPPSTPSTPRARRSVLVLDRMDPAYGLDNSKSSVYVPRMFIN